MPADAESYFGGACAIALTPKRCFIPVITASHNANMAGSLSDLTINSGVSKSVQRLDSFFDCCQVLHALASHKHAPNHHARLDVHHSKRSGSLGNLALTFRCWFLSIGDEPVIHACHKETVWFLLTTLRHQHRQPLDPIASFSWIFDLTALVSLRRRHQDCPSGSRLRLSQIHMGGRFDFLERQRVDN